jgi:hypothetical protein
VHGRTFAKEPPHYSAQAYIRMNYYIVIAALDGWRWMNHAAETAGRFYRGMYDHEAFV